jgi:hypothetical protein
MDISDTCYGRIDDGSHLGHGGTDDLQGSISMNHIRHQILLIRIIRNQSSTIMVEQ